MLNDWFTVAMWKHSVCIGSIHNIFCIVTFSVVAISFVHVLLVDIYIIKRTGSDRCC